MYELILSDKKKIPRQNQSKNFLPELLSRNIEKNNYNHLNLLGFLKTKVSSRKFLQPRHFSHLLASAWLNTLISDSLSVMWRTLWLAAVICLHFFTADMSIYRKFRAGRHLFPYRALHQGVS